MPRKKIIEDEEKEEPVEWDKPKIIIFFAVLGALIIGGLLFKHFFLDAQTSPSIGGRQEVQGAASQQGQDSSSQLPSVQDIKQSAQQEIRTLQQQASQISVQSIASSSPQIQQVIQQLQQVPQLPRDVAKQTCEQLCGKL